MNPLWAQSFVKGSHKMLAYYVYAPLLRLPLPRLAPIEGSSRVSRQETFLAQKINGSK